MQNRPQTITKARFRRFCRLVGKGMNFFGILKRFSLKYLAAAFVVVLFTEMVFGFAPHAAIQRPAATDVAAADSGSTDNDRRAQRLSRRERRRMKQAAEAQEPPVVSDTLVLQADSAPAARLAAGAVRFAPTRHHAPQKGGRSLPRRHHERQEHRLAGLRHPQQDGLHLQRGRHQLPGHEPQSRLHARQHGHPGDLRLREARHAGRAAHGHPPRIHRRFGLALQDGHHHLQFQVGQGQDQGRGDAGGRRMAHRQQREEDARQQHQHPGRQIHHLRPDGSPPLLSGP